MAYNFLGCDRDQPFLLPPDLRDWLPEGHLAWFILDIVDQVDLQRFYRQHYDDGTRRATAGREDTSLTVVLDCADLDRAAEFWCGALGYVPLSKEPGSGPYRILLPADGNGVELLLQQTADVKATKNRMHLDLRVLDLDAEVSRFLALGARYATDEPFQNNGRVWHVLLDPDDNEFCVLQPPDGHRDRLTRLRPRSMIGSFIPSSPRCRRQSGDHSS